MCRNFKSIRAAVNATIYLRCNVIDRYISRSTCGGCRSYRHVLWYVCTDSPDSSWQEGESSDQIEEVPKLSLPKSSNDLLLSNDLVLQALSVYEVRFCGF